jgi:hypothetical protein
MAADKDLSAGPPGAKRRRFSQNECARCKMNNPRVNMIHAFPRQNIAHHTASFCRALILVCNPQFPENHPDDAFVVLFFHHVAFNDVSCMTKALGSFVMQQGMILHLVSSSSGISAAAHHFAVLSSSIKNTGNSSSSDSALRPSSKRPSQAILPSPTMEFQGALMLFRMLFFQDTMLPTFGSITASGGVLSSKASILRLLTLSNSRAAVVTLNSNCHISSRCGVLQGI